MENIKKRSEACALQLYGYFVGTSMDYRVVNANLSRMWRVYEISDITKTSAGLFYFKFKNEEGMKAVLERALDGEQCKIFSGVGKPILMDKLTKERCLKKSKKLDFARVLVEVSVVDELLHSLEIEYPPFGNRPARVVSCKVRPRTEAEVAAKEKREIKSSQDNVYDKDGAVKSDEDGFVTVGRNNKPVGTTNREQSYKSKNLANNKAFQFRNAPMGNRFYGGNFRQSRYKGGNSKPGDVSLVHKPPLSSKYNEDFKHKVLVRGYGSTGNSTGAMTEDIPITNAFQVLSDQDMLDKEDEFIKGADIEYKNVIWPKLKLEVDDVMKLGVYPSLDVRSNWYASQLKYYYRNCLKYGKKPYVDDEDVESENDGMAGMMKPEDVVNGVPITEEIGNILNKQVIDLIREGGYNFCRLLETRVKKNKLSKICSKVLGNWNWMFNATMCDGGTGIVIGWDPNVVRIMLLSQSSQSMNVLVESVNGHHKFFCSFVYGHVKSYGRSVGFYNLINHIIITSTQRNK
ncbi:RNA-directed DNA polymerase, eukaryota, reverse transcriptase zinc-binding domain protein [Tanacetum coccineum]